MSDRASQAPAPEAGYTGSDPAAPEAPRSRPPERSVHARPAGQLRRCLALSGGVGGAKLALGLSRMLRPDALTIVCNTADDFDHLGLRVCPDLDTVMYTLAGVSNRATGWGQAHETWSFLDALGALGGETWFRLGDRDLATHVERTRRLRAGDTLTELTRALCGALGVQATVLPMSDDPVRTVVETRDGELSFQHYFVRHRCEPAVTGFRFRGASGARPTTAFRAALEDPELGAIVICPSNPFVSVDPVLAVPGVELGLVHAAAPVVAVSPIVGGTAIKGPAAKMMAELDMPVTAAAVARHYRQRGLLDGFVIDEADAAQAPEIEDLGVPTLVTGTVMETLAHRERLARETLEFAERLDFRTGRRRRDDVAPAKGPGDISTVSERPAEARPSAVAGARARSLHSIDPDDPDDRDGAPDE